VVVQKFFPRIFKNLNIFSVLWSQKPPAGLESMHEKIMDRTTYQRSKRAKPGGARAESTIKAVESITYTELTETAPTGPRPPHYRGRGPNVSSDQQRLGFYNVNFLQTLHLLAQARRTKNFNSFAINT
jgi:hypothetical protein